MEGNTARVICDRLPADDEDSYREMIDNCPIEAISIKK
jgi:ferredoxin